ncbi:MAG: hypothetical protein AAF733_03035 [Verrucomicrobiota bacterium]
MSEPQKVFASVSGAFAAHIVLLILIFVLLSTRSVNSALRDPSEIQASQPQEVVVLMSDLIEKMELETPEDVDRPLPFFDTDSNTPETEAPENAKFESDRNTTAASELAPNPNEPQQDLPTTEGDSPLPYFELQNREYTDGEFDQPPRSEGMAQVPSPSTGATLPPSPPSAVSDAVPGEESADGEAEETIEGVDTPPENEVAETLTRPQENPTDGDAETSTMTNSFDDPNSQTMTPAFGELDSMDQFAANAPKPEEEAEVGEMRDLAEEKELSLGGTGVDFENSQSQEVREAVSEESMNPVDEGLFADGFNPEELQNATNGALTNVGQNAVDAEGTAAGEYKKKVKQEISRMWHRYRVQHRDFVTYGILKIECRVDRYGKVHDLRVVENDANSVLAEFSLKAILAADLPAMPEDVAEELGPLGLRLKYDIIIY